MPPIVETTPAEIAPELLSRYARPLPRYTSYPPATAWTHEVSDDALAVALGSFGARREGRYSAYVHIPFCSSACWFCGCPRGFEPARRAAQKTAATESLSSLRCPLRPLPRALDHQILTTESCWRPKTTNDGRTVPVAVAVPISFSNHRRSER